MRMSLLAATKKRDDALAAVTAAKTTTDRTAAAKALQAASLDLAKVQARLEARGALRAEAETDDDEEDDEEEAEDEESEEEDDEPSKPVEDNADDDEEDEEDEEEEDDDDSDDDDDGDDDDSDDDDDDDEEEEEDEEEEKAKASALSSARSLLSAAKKGKDAGSIKAARAHLRSLKAVVSPKSSARYRKLRSACQRVTGKKSLSSIVGALDALLATAKSTEKLSADVRSMKARSRRERVHSLLTDARKAGKISSAQVDSLRAQGVKDPRWLKSYLATLPKQVRTTEEGERIGKTLKGKTDASSGGTTPEQDRAAALDAQGMDKQQREYLEQSAARVGKPFDEYVAEMNKHAAKGVTPANGAARS